MPFDMGNFNGGGSGPGGRPFSIEDMMAVAWFLRSAERDRQYFGGFSAEQAFGAACRIMQLPEDEFRREIDRIDGVDRSEDQ